MQRPEWIYDNSPIPDPFGHGEKAVTFLRRLKHPKSTAKGNAFQLDSWQERIVRRLYGPRYPDGRRIVRTAVMLLPRGNRKTALACALGLLHTVGPEHIPGGEAIFAASDRKQAGFAFHELKSIVREDPRLIAATQIHDSLNAAKRVTFKKDGARLETISCDGARQHGRTPNLIFADELHTWAKRDLWDALYSSMVKVSDVLLIVATTAGRGQENLAFDIVDHARKVASGERDDPSTLPILFEAGRDDDWQDEKVWNFVNPGMRHGYPDLEGMRSQARTVKDRPTDRDAFKQYNLNVWLDYSASPFVEMGIYDAGNSPVDLEALKGEPCWLGVDLSATSDLTVIVAAWRDADGGYIVHPWFFCPADNLDMREADRNGLYRKWADGGFLTPTPGNVVDYSIVENKIRELCETYQVRQIAFDPALAQSMMNNLDADGLPVHGFQQGWISMTPAINELERAILGRTLVHGGHPVLRWNFENIAVQVIDASGNRKFHKGKSKDKIDGAVATAMAVRCAQIGEGERSLYDDPSVTAEDFVFA